MPTPDSPESLDAMIAAFVQPKPAPFQLSIDTVMVGELVKGKATRPIIERELPILLGLGDTRFVGDATLRQLTRLFPAITPELLQRVDKELRALPPSEWPVPPVPQEAR